MSDLYEKTIKKYLLPIQKLTGEPSDAVYFLHKEDGFVYSAGYAHPPGGLYGSLIKYPDPDGHIDIFGKRFNWTHRRYVNGELEMVPYKEQVHLQMKQLPELAHRSPQPPYAEYFCHFLLDEFKGFFDSKNSLRIILGSIPRLDEIVSSIEELLGVPRSRLGCTGSLAYGFYEENLEDVDLVFFGSVAENRGVIERIRKLKLEEPDLDVYELGKSWPLRFKHMGAIICPFFQYTKQEEIPLRKFQMKVVKKSVSVTARVANDMHTAYLPAVLGLDEVVMDNKNREPIEFIIYDGSQRGEYLKNDRLQFRAQLVKITNEKKEPEALLVIGPEDVKKVT